MTNVGGADRVVRAILGFILILTPFLPFATSFVAALGVWKFAVAAVGVVLVGTAAFSFCPLYVIFRLNTCPAERR